MKLKMLIGVGISVMLLSGCAVDKVDKEQLLTNYEETKKKESNIKENIVKFSGKYLYEEKLLKYTNESQGVTLKDDKEEGISYSSYKLMQVGTIYELVLKGEDINGKDTETRIPVEKVKTFGYFTKEGKDTNKLKNKIKVLVDEDTGGRFVLFGSQEMYNNWEKDYNMYIGN